MWQKRASTFDSKAEVKQIYNQLRIQRISVVSEDERYDTSYCGSSYNTKLYHFSIHDFGKYYFKPKYVYCIKCNSFKHHNF